MNKTVRIALVAIFGLALLAGLWKSFFTQQETTQKAEVQAKQASVKRIKLLVGSAKFNFLKDPKLQELMANEGIELELVKTGSFADDTLRAKDFDAVWPAGANAAADFSQAWKAVGTYPVFVTPLAIASWKPLLPVLEANGLAKGLGPLHGDFYLAKALPLMTEAKRWNQLKDNTVFSVNRGFLVNTPDVRKSATGSLYIAALAYTLNNDEAPTDLQKAQMFADKLSPLITRQGFQEATLSGPFEDYLSGQMGKAPLVLIYESQFVEAKRANKLPDTAFLLYPQPGLVLKHVVVARTEVGKKLGEFLANNVRAQEIAAQYGFRTNDPKVFAKALKEVGLAAPDLLNLADAPSTVILDAMNSTLAKKLEGN